MKLIETIHNSKTHSTEKEEILLQMLPSIIRWEIKFLMSLIQKSKTKFGEISMQG